MRTARLLGAALAVALAPALGGCDAASADPQPEPNTFTLRVGDGEPETRRGAYVGTYVSEATGNPTFAVLLGTDPVASALSLSDPAVGFVRDGGRPAAGAHPLEAVNADTEPPADAFVGFYLDPAAYVRGESPPRSGFYFTGGGSLRLESLTDGGARGSFTMTAVEFDVAQPGGTAPTSTGVTVTGTFEAVPSDAFGADGALLGRRPAWLRWLPFAG